MALPAVTIVIPNFNGDAIIGESLKATLQATAAYSGGSEIIVVDDASTDHSTEVISDMDADIRIVQHRVNRGFGEAVHSGVAAASHERIVLLNSDVHPRPNFLLPLLTAIDDNSVFAATPLILDVHGEPLFVSWARYRLVHGKLRSCRWTLEQVYERLSTGRALQSLYASGGSIAFRKTRFEALNGFLSIYKPFYSEDLDLCTRAWMRGWSTVLIPTSQVVHDNNGTINRLFSRRRVRVIRLRNRLIYLCLHANATKLVVFYLPRNLWWGLIRLLRLDTTMMSALLRILKCSPAILRMRRELRQDSVLPALEQVLDRVNAD